MKNLLSLLILFLSFTLKAQTYIPMPLENGMMWRAFGVYSVFEHYDEDKITGDSVLGGVLYKKISRKSYSAPSTLFPYFPPYASYLIREDTAAKKIFLRYGTTDTLLYDFNLQVGDTIHGVMLAYMQNSGIDTVTIASVDSILLNGVYHKRFNSTPVAVPLTGLSQYAYIVGIGSTSGLLSTCFKFECASFLVCVGKVYNQSLYPDSTYNCIYATSTRDFNQRDRIQIYPNPSSDFIRIHSPENICKVKIADMYGNILYHNKVYKDNEVIDINMYARGIYSIQVMLDKHILVNRKLSIE